MSPKNIRREKAVNVLRVVSPDKAFYFYREIGQPLGVISRASMSLPPL